MDKSERKGTSGLGPKEGSEGRRNRNQSNVIKILDGAVNTNELIVDEYVSQYE